MHSLQNLREQVVLKWGVMFSLLSVLLFIGRRAKHRRLRLRALSSVENHLVVVLGELHHTTFRRNMSRQQTSQTCVTVCKCNRL